MRSIFLIIVVAAMLLGTVVSAQDRRAEAEGAYSQLRQSFQQQTGTNPQGAELERIHSVETWLQRNDWRELPVKEQAWLCDALSGLDKIDKRAFSVRWTGLLRVPATGSYTFSQLAIPGAEGSFQLWIDDRLILDNVAASAKEDDRSAVQKSLPGGAVVLTAGTSVSFRLDYVRAPVVPQPGVMRLPGFPAAVLAWQSDVLDRQVVPSGAFSTQEGAPGVTGEYFSDTTFTQQVATRIDPNVDFMWDVGLVATEQQPSRREIVSQVAARIAAPGFLNSLDPAEAKNFIQEQLPVLFGVMSASERVAVLQVVSEQPDLLHFLTFPQMAAALRWYSTLADSAGATDLFVKWGKMAPLPRTQLGFSPGRSPGGYLNLNVEPYFRLSRLFLGENVNANIDALSAHIATEDGSCNLTVAYVLMCVCRMAEKQTIIFDLIDEPVHDEDLDPEIRSTWLIAEAFALETLLDYDFQPGRGLGPLHEALDIAETPATRFWLLQEIVARLIALDQVDQARSKIESVREQFTSEDQRVQMDAWLAKGIELQTHYEDVRAQMAEEADTLVMGEYLQELRRRSVVADQQGDQLSLHRYQQSIAALEARQEKKKKMKQDQ